MNWVERRDREDSGISEFWNVFCIHNEQISESFGKSRFARDNALMAVASRNNNCLHIVRSKSNTNPPQRSIDLCLDEKRRRVFARIEGDEQSALVIGLDNDYNVCLLGPDGNVMTNDQTSKFFLEKFFFSA
jgi:hypothetical protein